MMIQNNPPYKIGLCLPGGGAAGSIQAGMLYEIDKYISGRVAAVSCASVGSLNGAMYVSRKMNECREVWETMRSGDVYSKWSIFRLFGNSYFNNAPLAKLIDKNIDPEVIRQSPIQLFVQTVNELTGDVEHAQNFTPNINKWLLASTSIPIVFPSIEINNNYYCDGGVADNTPLSPLIDCGCNLIFMLHCSPEKMIREKPGNRLGRLTSIIRLLMQSSQQWDTKYLRKINEMVQSGATTNKKYIDLVEIWPDLDIGTMDFSPKTGKAGFNHGRECVQRLNSGILCRFQK